MKTKDIIIVTAVVLVLGFGIYLIGQPSHEATPGGTQNSNATSTDITLGVGATKTYQDLSITFNKFVQDSRCPVDVECIQAGAVNLNVTLASKGLSETRNLASDEVPYRFGAYQISITDVTPQRKSKTEIPPNAYQITFHIAGSASSLSPAAAAVQSFAAQEYNVSLADVVVRQAAAHTWPNSCLGLAAPSEICAQALVEGNLVTVTVGGKDYTYRTNTTGSVIRQEF